MNEMNEMTTDPQAHASESSPQRRTKGPANRAPQPVQKEGSLYASRPEIYPRKVSGPFRTVKWATVIVLLGIYYIAPWIRWDRGANAPDQAFLVDMEAGRAYFLWVEIWPQEVYYLAGMLIMGAIGLFCVTAIAGRVWCGFTCPQTVWTDLYMWVERWVEGDRNARLRLDHGPLTLEKVRKKIVKHSLWLLIAVATGGAWIMYFNDAPTVVPQIFTLEASTGVYSFIGLFTATTYLLAGWAREQVCIYMCPWPRFQAAMFDEHSYIVTYEDWRGEPRGGAKKTDSFDDRGDCVDCGMCVQVCPTGVDIREGQQMACIGCALCVDACNDIMARYNRPPDLIRYDSISNQLTRQKGEQPPEGLKAMRLLRPRIIVYLVLLSVIASIFFFSLTTRERLEINLIRDRAPLFVTLSDGSIRNGYTLKILNMKREEKTFRLTIDGLDQASFAVIGLADPGSSSADLPVKPDSVGSFRVFVTAPRSVLDGKTTDFDFIIDDDQDGQTVRHANVFSGP